MKNAFAIGDLAGLMTKNCETIGSIVLSMNNAEQGENQALMESYSGMLLNALENAQTTLLCITQLITELTHEHINNDSAFQPGELDDDIGDKTEIAVHRAVSEEEEEE